MKICQKKLNQMMKIFLEVWISNVFYVTSEKQANFSLFNMNIQSFNKNFDKLKQCLKSVNHNFNVIF